MYRDDLHLQHALRSRSSGPESPLGQLQCHMQGERTRTRERDKRACVTVRYAQVAKVTVRSATQVSGLVASSQILSVLLVASTLGLSGHISCGQTPG